MPSYGTAHSTSNTSNHDALKVGVFTGVAMGVVVYMLAGSPATSLVATFQGRAVQQAPSTLNMKFDRTATSYSASAKNEIGASTPSMDVQHQPSRNIDFSTGQPMVSTIFLVALTGATAIAAYVWKMTQRTQQKILSASMLTDIISTGKYNTTAMFSVTSAPVSQFEAETIKAFPQKANATVEEARVLWNAGGYSILDIRSDMEGREGRIRSPNKGTIDISMFTAKSTYDPNLGKKVVKQEVNAKWLDEVKARFPSKDAKIVVMCSDGTTRSKQALNLLANEGYRNLVLLRGGYNRWDQIYDSRQNIRTPAQQAAKAEWLDDPVQWGTWSRAAGVAEPAQRPVAPGAAPETRTVREVPKLGEFQDDAFQRQTVAAFPGKANATVEEARVLWKLDGYSFLDVRSDMEGREGRIRGPNKGSIDIPMFTATSSYDSTVGTKVVKQTVNAKWLDEVKARFPDKDAKIIVFCSDGTKRSQEAINLLAAEGYRNLVLMRGGYNRWDQIFDKQLAVRSPNQQAAKGEWLDDPVQWDSWTNAVGRRAPTPRSTPSSAAPVTRTERSLPSAGQFQDPAFQRETLAAFPAKANATVEEARVLWKLDNYSILDVRSDMEGKEGRIRGPNKGSIDIPMFTAKATYDSNLGRKVVTQTVNRQWLDQVRARFPNKDSKIIVMCSDGITRSEEAINLLAAQGYRNVVLMRGGYKRWDQVFDSKLILRSPAQQAAKAEWLDDPVKWDSWARSAGSAPAPPRQVAAGAAPAARTVRATATEDPFLDPSFQAATKAVFPPRDTANAEEARVLWSQNGYSLLDIRSDMEGQEGRIRGPNKGSIDIPMFTAKATYDSNLARKVVTQTPNAKWLDQVKARFPGKDSKIVLVCSDGGSRSAQASKLLKSQGYTNVVVLAGGFKAWDQLFDRNLMVRSPAAQAAKAALLQDPIVWGQWSSGSSW